MPPMKSLFERFSYGGGLLLDDVAITAGVGTPIAADLIAGSNYQRVKLIQGADGVNAGDVSSINGLPVQPQAGLGATPFPIVPGIRLTEQFTRVAINSAAGGTIALVAAVAAQTWKLFGIVFTVASAVTVKLSDGTVDMTGAMSFGAGGGLILTPQGEPYWTAAGANRPLNLVMGSTVQISGTAWYILS